MRERGFCWSRSGCLAGSQKISFPCLANQVLWLRLTSTLECLGMAPRTSEVPCWSVAWFSFWHYSLSTCLLIKSAPVYHTKAVGRGQSWSDLHLHTGQWTYDMKYLINDCFSFCLFMSCVTYTFWRLHYGTDLIKISELNTLDLTNWTLLLWCFYLVRIGQNQVKAKHQFTLLSVAFRVVQMISFSFCLQIGLHPNFFEKGAVDLLAHYGSAVHSSAESIWCHHGVSACPWCGGGSTTGKTCIGWPLFPGLTDILWALVACCILRRGCLILGAAAGGSTRQQPFAPEQALVWPFHAVSMWQPVKASQSSVAGLWPAVWHHDAIDRKMWGRGVGQFPWMWHAASCIKSHYSLLDFYCVFILNGDVYPTASQPAKKR